MYPLSFLPSNRLVTWLVVIVLIFSLFLCVPLQTIAFGGGGGGFSPSSLISFAAGFALSFIGVPPIWSILQNFAQQVATQGLIAAITNITLSQVASLVVDVAVQGISFIGSSASEAISNAGADSGTPSTGYNLYAVVAELSQIEVGGDAVLSGMITNNGSQDITGTFYNRFELFNQSSITDNSHDLFPSPIYASVESGLVAGVTASTTATWTVPTTFTPGEYFLRLCANTGNSVSESNPDNNCGDLRPFTIVAAPVSFEHSLLGRYVIHLPIIGGIVAFTDKTKQFLFSIAEAAGDGDLTSGAPSIWPAPKGGVEVAACPFGYYFVAASNYCIPDGYVTCANVGYPNLACASGTFCRTDGQCESGTGGQYCKGGYNQACQSAANSCGLTGNGFGSCDGSCQAVVPADSLCVPPVITLREEPVFITKGGSCTVTWSTEHTTSCTLTDIDTGQIVASGVNNSYVTGPLTVRKDFVLHCQNGKVISAEAKTSCRLNPAFEEH